MADTESIRNIDIDINASGVGPYAPVRLDLLHEFETFGGEGAGLGGVVALRGF